MAASEFQQRIERIEGLVQKLESAPDPGLRQTARSLMESVMALHGAGLGRILEILRDAGEQGAGILSSLASDELAGSLLVLYDLHPDDFETRVRRGLEKVRPLLRSHGARFEHVAIDNGAVRLKVAGNGSDGLEPAIRNALLQTAPDATEVAIEGAHSASFVPLSSLMAVVES